MDLLQRLFEIVLKGFCFFDTFNPHEHWCDKLDKNTGNNASPVDHVDEDLEMIDNGSKNPRQNYPSEVIARNLTHS